MRNKKIKPYFGLLEHKADMGIRGYGNSFEEAFQEAAKAMFSIMVELETVQKKDKFEIRIEENSLEKLFVKWLNELLYLSDAKQFLFKEFKIKDISERKNTFSLTATAFGEKLNEKKHILNTEVKAATYSGLKVEKQGNICIAQCVVDV
ncbi:MAG: archease [archaeon]